MKLTIPDITAEDARTLTDRIKVGVEAVWHLITEAYTSRAYIALGYRNWDDYCTREFGTSRLRLPREDRPEVVASLRESGMSVRAIAVATGVARNTVRSTLRDQVGQIDPPELDEEPLTQAECEALAQSEDVIADYLSQYDDADLCDDCGDGACECPAGQCNCVTAPGLPESDRPDWEVEGESAIEYFNRPLPDATPEKRITGTDGKSYPAPKPTREKPNRVPITKAFDSASYELRKAVERIVRLTNDDRIKKNRDQISGSNLSDLVRVRDAIDGVINTLGG